MKKQLKLRYKLSLLFSVSFALLIAQDPGAFAPPLKIPMILSGNYGELRTNHFHSGIDIKTKGTTGQHIFSIADGYISRIKVQTGGYGLSVYITHPDGHTSLYGHLSAYRDDIRIYVENAQYKRRSQTLDLWPGKELFPVKKGDFIGYSGNTGSSKGPHLHFEIRESGQQIPLNALKYYPQIEDHRAPRFAVLHLVPTGVGSHVDGSKEASTITLQNQENHYSLTGNRAPEVNGEVAIGVEIYDYLDGAANRCGIYTLEMYVDGQKVYRQRMEEISFAETAYINAHIDYAEKIRSRKSIQMLHRIDSNPLSIYSTKLPNRAPAFTLQKSYDIRIVAKDVAGNSSELNFRLQGNGRYVPDAPEDLYFLHSIPRDEDMKIETRDFILKVRKNSLFRDLDLNYRKNPGPDSLLSPLYELGSLETPVRRKLDLSFAYRPEAGCNTDKLLLITYDQKGEAAALDSHYEKGYVRSEAAALGTFAITLDTLAPVIRMNSRPDQAKKLKNGALRLYIADELSGVTSWHGYVDNHWALFSYDPKNDRLEYKPDKKRIKQGFLHEFEVYIEDAKGNTSLMHGTFHW